MSFRTVQAGGTGTHATVADINADMLSVGRERARERGLDDAVTFVDANAEGLPFPDRSFDAVSIAFGIRNVPRIDVALAEMHRVLRLGGRFLCLEFSNVDVPGLDALYELYSFNVVPVIGRAVVGDAEPYRYLVEFDPPLPAPERVRRHDARRRFAPRVASGDERRHRGAAFRLALVISAVGHLFRLARAGFVFAREGVLGLADPAPLPAPARLGLKLARLIERPTAEGASVRLSTALTRLGPTYVKLGQFLATRPDVVGPALARDLELLQDRMAPFPQAEAEAQVAAALGKPLRDIYASFGPPSRPPPSRRCIRPKSDGQAVAVKVLRPGIERRFRSDLDTLYFAARTAERHSAEARRLS